MEDDAQAAASSIDRSVISKVYHNLPVIFWFLVTWADINKDFSSHELIQLYKVCHDIAWLLRNKTMRKKIYDCLGDLYRRIGRFKDAMDCYKELLELCKRPYDAQGTAAAHNGIGNVHLTRGEYKDAMECIKKCLKICQQTDDLAGEAKAHNNIGLVHQSRGEYKKAMECYKKSLKICQQTGDLAGEGKAHNNIGTVHRSRGEYKEAMEYFKKKLKICQHTGDSTGEGSANYNIGNVHCSRGEYKGAIECYKKFLKICQQTDELTGEGAAHHGIGTVHRSQGENKEAMECYKKSLKIFQQTGDLAGEAKAHNNIGLVHQSRGEYKKAMECYKKSLKICQQTGDLAGEGAAHHGIGTVHRSRGQYKKAMECYKKSLKICQQTGDLAGEGTVHGSIGNVHWSCSEYKDAMECYKKCLKICQQTGVLEGVGAAHNGIGNVHRSLGEYNEAMECYKKCLKICQHTGDMEGEGNAHNNIGGVHKSREYKEAMECYKKSLKIFQQSGNLAREGEAHKGIGDVHRSRGEYKEAMECYKKYLKICQQSGDLAGEGNAHHCIGVIHHARGEYKKAMECFKKDLKICQQTGNVSAEAKVRHNIGSLCIRLFDWYAAESQLMESVRCSEKVFSVLSQHDHSKVSIVDTYIKTYQLLTFVLVAVKKIKQALLISERGRSQALRDKLLDKYQIASKDVSTVVDSYSDVSSLTSSNDSTFLEFSLSPSEDILFTFIVSMKEKESCKELSKDNLASIVNNCPDNEIESILDSWVKQIIEDANVHVHENRENTFEDRSMGQDDADVFEQEQLTRESNTPRLEHEDVNILNCVSGEDLLKYLYQALIAPINDQLVEPEIVIVPDGPLFLVPFAALQSPDGPFLSDTKRIRIGPSLTILKLLKEYPLEKQSKMGALIVGGPIVRDVLYRGGFRKGFGDLPGAWKEATEIGKILDETPLTKESATKEEVMRRLQEGVAIIHIATHGNANTGELLLAPAPHIYQHHIPTEEDYMLTIKDISSCKINAQLVVLSCCHSGRGQVRAEGVVGLTRAFLAAGARSVLAALWEISDEGTLFFMMSFYGHLKRGESASTSLQEAMREMKSHPRWSHPYYWGSFFIVGHDVTI